MTTFAKLGIPFPLFEAPSDEASEYVGVSTCLLCNSKRHCFRLGIGDALVLPCPKCATDAFLDADDRVDRTCGSCGTVVVFPSIPKEKEVQVCYDCLRSGKGTINKDTEFGMVSWEQALQGITHGIPGLKTDEFERVLIDAQDEWYGVRVPKEHLFELLRTPTMNNWQDESWLFCCKQPMTYIGEWASVVKSRFDGKIDRSTFDKVFTQDASKEWLWERLSSRKMGSPCLYIYECKKCARFRSTYDMD